ncbi:MAG: glycoside hydrolase family 25 protein [Oscillospiraceae bacterium]|nr:glycoside hydrolase family 25 protein [Oscillospiraceae bacterium]
MNKKIVIIIVVIVIALISILFLSYPTGLIIPNNLYIKNYTVRGVDVSSYQGDIDWSILSKQNISFAYIKATEGSSFVDDKFQFNWDEANKTDLKVGAYHYFSYDSDGMNQAENFIKTVPINPNSLPPVIDIELYGDKVKNIPDKTKTQEQLSILLDELQNYYGKKPVIYVTNKTYNLYIKGNFDDYNIWIRKVFYKPNLSNNKSWTLWQYTDKAKLDGYNGAEKFIDMNVFNGTAEEFDKFVQGDLNSVEDKV